MRNNQRKNSKDDSKNSLYIIGAIFIILVMGLISLIVSYTSKINSSKSNFEIAKAIENRNNEDTQTASSKIGKTVEESMNEIENILEDSEIDEKVDQVTNANLKNEVQNIIMQESQANIEPTTQIVDDPTFSMPVDGEIIKEYAKENLVYSETLQEWVTHNGIDIKADKATIVKASEEGTVTSIKNDPRYGMSITIEHVNGFSTRYSNLLTTEFVVVGEKVVKGQTIGTVGNTAAFEIADDSHLHFEILKDNENLNPTLYIK